MRLVAIETSGRALSLALYDGKKKPLGYWKNMGAGHAEVLFEHLERLLRQKRWSLPSLNAVAVDLGPGSFTGTRVGLSVARALGQTLNIPLVGRSSLNILAEGRRAKSWVCPMIDALRDDVYTALYRWTDHGLVKEWPEQIMPLSDLVARLQEKTNGESILFNGDGVVRHAEILEQAFGRGSVAFRGKALHPQAAILAVQGWKALERGEGKKYDQVVPLYLRPPLAEEKWKERLGVSSEPAC